MIACDRVICDLLEASVTSVESLVRGVVLNDVRSVHGELGAQLLSAPFDKVRGVRLGADLLHLSS